MNTIHLDPKLVPNHLRGSYQGKMFKARVCEQWTIPMTAGLWDDGSRDKYHAINFETGEAVTLPGQNEAPWGDRREYVVQLKPGFCLVKHSIFCGKDMGLTFYIHPENATKMLPAPVELTSIEKMVLHASAHLKSSYMGKNRYQMTVENMRYSNEPFPSYTAWEEAKVSLIAKGLLNKAGAITVKGRNAC